MLSYFSLFVVKYSMCDGESLQVGGMGVVLYGRLHVRLNTTSEFRLLCQLLYYYVLGLPFVVTVKHTGRNFEK